MTTTAEVKIYATPQKVFKAVAKEIKKLIEKSEKNNIHIALSGGNSPKGLFKKISKKYADSIPWGKIHIWWGDERCVPPEDNESNYKMTVETLLSKIEIPENNIHRIKGEADPLIESQRYGTEITSHLGEESGLPVFDLILLGLGDDGHTASIFPDQPDLLKAEEICAVAEHPVSKQKRITLTGEVINNAENVFFLVIGENKAERIAEIMNDEENAENLPAYHIQPKKGKLIWYIDEPATQYI